MEIDLGKPVVFDRVMIREPIRFGQRISEFEVTGLIDGNWSMICKGTTVGYKRIFQITPVNASMIRLNIKNSTNIPAISGLSLFKSPSDQ